MPFTVEEFHDLVRILEEKPEWRNELRRLILTDQLLALPEQLAELREMMAGETLVYDAEILTLRAEGASVVGRVTVEGQLTAEAEIFFAHLDQSRSKQLFGDHNFVFGGEMKYLLGQLAKAAQKQ